MAQEHDLSTGQKVWSGKYTGPDGAFNRGRAAYRASARLPEDRSAWSSILYSQITSVLADPKWNGRPLWTLFRNGLMLWPQMEYFRMRAFGKKPVLENMSANACETVSGIMRNFAKIPVIGPILYFLPTCRYAEAALAAPQEDGGHTRSLAALTLAAMLSNDVMAGQAYLEEALKYAPYIQTPNQQARVYRTAALLYHGPYDDYNEAYGLIMLAAGIQSLSADVIVKNEAAMRTIFAKK